jgi:ATP-dependent helicase/DNAse subunit B
LGGVVKAEDAANRTEAALAVADGFNQSATDVPTASLYNWLLTQHREHWQHIVRVRHIEQQRMTGRTFDNYNGRLQDARLLEWVAGELGDKRIWSASQFNDYGLCGFRFFSKRLLKLEAIQEPETGMDNKQRGTVIHAILEDTYRELAKQGISINPNHMDTAIEILQQVAARILPDAPQAFGFRESVLWAQEQVTLMRKVEALVRADFSDKSPLGKEFKVTERTAYMQEVPLGGKDSTPLRLNLGGNVVKVNGYIDRIDRIGDQAIVVDYKSGSTTIPISEMTEGRNFQMMLYLLAGEAILERERQTDANVPTHMAGGTFWHLNRSLSGQIHMDDLDDTDALAEAQAQLGEQLRQGRSGNFASVPNRKGNGACSHYCEFTQFCRVSIMNRRKRA